MKEPKIRFKEFKGEWESIPFSKIMNRISTSGQAGTLPGVEFEDIDSGEGRLNKDVYQKECNKYGKLFQNGDILFGKLRPYLKNILLADFEGIAIGDFWVLRSLDNDSKFLYTLVNTDSFMKIANTSSGSKMPRADWNLVSSTEFSISSDKNEQIAIGNFFTTIDAQISASASRLASLKQMKAASLQAMFPQEGETVPKIRFKGFEGEWETVKLSECLEISNERNLNNDFGTNEVLSVSDEEGVMNQIKLLGRSYAGKSVTNYKVLRTNQVVYTKSPLKAKPYGIVKVNKGEIGIVSVLYAVYNAKDGVSPDYIHYYFEPTFRINNYLLPLINKGAKNTMNISDEASLQGNIVIPKTIDEQCKIVDYFQSLDRQITLQSQRLEKLKQVKATCLDKMFV